MLAVLDDQAAGLRRLFQSRELPWKLMLLCGGTDETVQGAACFLKQRLGSALIADACRGRIGSALGARLIHDLTRVLQGRIRPAQARVRVNPDLSVVSVFHALRRSLPELKAGLQTVIGAEDERVLVVGPESLADVVRAGSAFGWQDCTLVMDAEPDSLRHGLSAIRLLSGVNGVRDFQVLFPGLHFSSARSLCDAMQTLSTQNMRTGERTNVIPVLRLESFFSSVPEAEAWSMCLEE
jgi:hypothetical protein